MKKKITSYNIGMFAETIAIALLTFKFYRIIERRYKTKVGEVDIIALRGRTIVFIEVKKRNNKSELFESITQRQQNRIRNTAQIFLSRNRHYTNHKMRFDAILIPSNLIPIHIKNAW